MSRKRPNPLYLGRCFLCERVVVGDPSGFRHLPPLPRNAGHVSMSFGYGSRHDVSGFDGLICDDCAQPFKATMAGQTRERLAQRRASLIRQGCRFATDREITRALKCAFQPEPTKTTKRRRA